MKKPVILRRSALAVALVVLFGNLTVDAGNTWDGGGANGLWSNATNWDLNTLPSANGNLVFAGTSQLASQNDLFTAGTTFNGLFFNAGAGAFVVSGNSITLNGNVTNSATATQTVALNLALAGSNRESSTIAGGTSIFSGVISGAFRFQATGFGTTILNGAAANTYTGQTSAANGGTLVLDFTNLVGSTNLVSATSQLNLGNGNAPQGTNTLRVIGAATGATSQTFSSYSLAGTTVGKVVLTPGGAGTSTTLNLGNGTVVSSRGANAITNFDISSTAGGAMNIVGPTGSFTGGGLSNGVYGWATVTDATGTGLGQVVGGNIVRLTGQTALAANSNSATTNYRYASAGTLDWTTGITNRSINSLTIDTSAGAGGLNLGASTNVLTIGSRGVYVSGANALTLNGGQIGANGSEVILFANGSGGITINSLLSGTNGTFTKAGPDTVTLTAANTYTGPTAILTGTLRAGAANVINSSSVLNINSDASAVFDLNNFNQSVGGLQYGGVLNNPAIQLGTATLTTGTNNTAYSFAGIIAGSGNLVKVGTATQALTAASTYTGTTTISNGTLQVRNANALGVNSAVTVESPGILDLVGTNLLIGSLSGSGSVTNQLNDNVTGIVTTGSANTSTTFSGAITSGTTAGRITGFTKTGTGTQTLGGANTYTGTTTVNNGTLLGTQAGGTPFGTGAVAIGTGTLSLAPAGTGSNVTLTGGTLASGTLFTYNPGAVFSLNKGSQTSLTYTFGGGGTAFARGTSGTFILSTSSIAGLGAATGGERFLINGTAPTLTNGIILGGVAQDRGNNNAGDFLTYDASNGFKAAAYGLTNTLVGSTNTQLVNIAAGTSTGTAAAYAMKVSGTLTNTGTLTLGGAASGTAGLILNGGTITGGTLAATSGSEHVIYTSSAGGTISSNITGGSGMSVTGPGVLTLAGTTNSFTGSLKVLGSTVSATTDAQLGATTGNINLTGGTLRTSGTFALGTTAQRSIILTPGSGATGGTFDVSSGTTTFTSTGGGKVISGTGSLTKTGTGTLVLTGANTNTYTGATNVNAGTLVVNGGGTAAASAVTVASGATLAGSGTVGGATTISGNHAPGNLGIGTQTFSNNLTYNSGSTFSWQLGDETPAANFDSVAVGGALNIAASGATFNVIVTGLDIAGTFWMSDRSWDVFDSASAGAGNFDSFALYDASNLNTSVPYAGYGTFTFTPVTGVLSWNSAVPEPTNALAGLLIGAGLLRRRRSVKK